MCSCVPFPSRVLVLFGMCLVGLEDRSLRAYVGQGKAGHGKSRVRLQVCTSVTLSTGVAEKFIEDCRAVAEELLRDPAAAPTTSMGALYGTSQTVPDRALVGEAVHYVWEGYYTVTEPQASRA